MTAPDAPALPPPIPAWKLLVTLGGGGAVAGLAIVVAFQSTQPRIQEHKARVLEASVKEVLGGPESYEPVYFVGGALTTALPAGADAAKTEKIYAGRRADGSLAGYAIVAAEPGFADDIKLIFGWDPERSVVLGFKVLENKETPGLGDGIEKNAQYTGQFAGKRVDEVAAPRAGEPPVRLVPVKTGASKGVPEREVQTITGATISSSTVVRIINNAVAKWEPRVRGSGKEPGR